MELFQRFLNQANKVYSKADKKLGGWLPGGGVASPITKTIFPAQQFPGRSKELEKITGVKGRFIDINKTPTLIRKIAPLISPQWGESNYANLALNEVGMAGYKGGATPFERSIEFHELGHLNPKDRGLYSYGGVLGRSLQGLSEKAGNPPLLDIGAGLALQYADAPEEDRAERFAARYAKEGNYEAPDITSAGTSLYGNKLRKEGKDLVSSGLQAITNPFGVVSGLTSFVNTQRSKPLQAELSTLSSQLQKKLETEGDQLSPSTLELNRRHSLLSEQLKKLGIEPQY